MSEVKSEEQLLKELKELRIKQKTMESEAKRIAKIREQKEKTEREIQKTVAKEPTQKESIFRLRKPAKVVAILIGVSAFLFIFMALSLGVWALINGIVPYGNGEGEFAHWWDWINDGLGYGIPVAISLWCGIVGVIMLVIAAIVNLEFRIYRKYYPIEVIQDANPKP